MLAVDGREAGISNPQKVIFPEAGCAKLDLARYFPAVSTGALPTADVLVDAVRGRFSSWTRIRVNLQHVPDGIRPRPGQPSRNCLGAPPRRAAHPQS